MPDLAKVNSTLAFLRAGDSGGGHLGQSSRRTSAQHEQDYPRAPVAGDRQGIVALDTARALIATAGEWVSIAGAIALCTLFWHPALYVLAVMFIGARQHALIIMGHDASHYRYLPKRWQNELLGNIFLMWPVFASIEGFRKFHSTHHQFTHLPNDGNRHIWYTHDAAGELEPDWVFPKTRAGLALVLLRRAAFLTGMFWIVRGVVGSSLIPSPNWMVAARVCVLCGRGRS